MCVGKVQRTRANPDIRGASLKVKGKVYRVSVQTVLVYGSETWPLKVEDMQRLERTERMMVRWMCGVSLKNRISSEELNRRLGIESVAVIVKRGRLGWFGHLEPKDTSEWVSACRNFEVAGEKIKGRGRKTWGECVRHDLRSGGLKEAWAQDKIKWKSDWGGNRPTRASMESGRKTIMMMMMMIFCDNIWRFCSSRIWM